MNAGTVRVVPERSGESLMIVASSAGAMTAAAHLVCGVDPHDSTVAVLLRQHPGQAAARNVQIAQRAGVRPCLDLFQQKSVMSS